MESQIHDLKAEFAPDKRVKLFEVKAAPKGQAVLLKGKTNYRLKRFGVSSSDSLFFLHR